MLRHYDSAARIEKANDLLDAGQPERARSLLEGSVPSALEIERSFLFAESYRSQGFFGMAAKHYRKILGDSRTERSLLFESCLGLASVYRSLGQTSQARQLLRKARAGARLSGQRRERLELEEALVDRAQGLYGLSLRKLSRFLKLFRARGDWAGVGFILWAMGGSRRFSGDLAGSERDYRDSLSAFRRSRDDAGQAYALFGLGGITRIRGKLKESERHYAEAGRRLAKTPDVFGQAYAFCGLANSLRQQGKSAQARALYLRSHRLYSSLGDRVDLAYVDWGLGKLALQQGRLKEAEVRLTQALKAFEHGREDRGIALSRTALATLLHAIGRTRQAEALFDRAVKDARKAGLHAHLEIYT